MKNFNFYDFSEMNLDGQEEARQKIPRSSQSRSGSRHSHYALEAFEDDMSAYARRRWPGGAIPRNVTFIHFRPTYKDMSPNQKNWYLYWRDQVRADVYLETDYPYIQLHTTELISGYGWDTPEDGYRQLLALWSAYRSRYVTMDLLFPGLSFDFADEYGLEYAVPEELGFPLPQLQNQRNILISRYLDRDPLRMPYELILSLSNYDPKDGSFWKEGHDSLIQEAVTRVVALCDILLRRERNKGLLQALGPLRPKTITYTPYEGTFCMKSAEPYDIPLIDYTGGRTLTHYVTELIRHTENVLRDIGGFRGRLRDVDFDPQTGRLVEQFLRKEYTPAPEPEPEEPKLKLDFSRISELRKESDAVREALVVPDAEDPLPPEPAGQDEIVVSPPLPLPEDTSVKEEKTDISNAESAGAADLFRMEFLTPEMHQILCTLSPVHCQALHALLTLANPQERLNQLAREENVMPRTLLDQINDTAMDIMGDILIESIGDRSVILDYYEPELKSALR